MVLKLSDELSVLLFMFVFTQITHRKHVSMQETNR